MYQHQHQLTTCEFSLLCRLPAIHRRLVVCELDSAHHYCQHQYCSIVLRPSAYNDTAETIAQICQGLCPRTSTCIVRDLAPSRLCSHECNCMHRSGTSRYICTGMYSAASHRQCHATPSTWCIMQAFLAACRYIRLQRCMPCVPPQSANRRGPNEWKLCR